MSAAFHADRFAPSRGQDHLGRDVAVDGADQSGPDTGHLMRLMEAEVVQLLVPPRDQLRTRGGYDFVGTGVGPCTAVPRSAQFRPGLLAGMGGAPFGFVAANVASDLGGALAEGSRERAQLADFTGVVEG